MHPLTPQTFILLKIIWSQNLNILLEHKTRIYILAFEDLGVMPRKTNMFSLISPKGKEIQLEINIVGLKQIENTAHKPKEIWICPGL